MNATTLAMRRPITTLMLVVALISGGALACTRMRVDIFPSLNTPHIYIFLDYIGMSPDQMEGFIVNQLELYFQYVNGIRDINSRNIQQVALCELSFFPGTDMGQAMALNVKSRTLRAEIDLPNPGSQLLPGMYAYAEVVIECPGVRSVPVAALTHRGNQAFYWACEDGKAVRTEVERGVGDGEWIEVTNRRLPAPRAGSAGRRTWTRIDGSEQLILGDLSILTQGARVRVAEAAREARVARADPLPDGRGGSRPPTGR